jgi:HTH-type transcriptional repressor of NAD biosynthesis genes
MYRGLVVGKFCPLHKGHEMVIDAAFAKCDKVVIISYTSLANAPSAAHRRLWLTTLYPDALVIVPESGFPDDNDSEDAHRKYCFDICDKLNVIPDAIFASEQYVYGFAERMGELANKNVDAHMVDLERSRHPISGTALRNAPEMKFAWCPTIVSYQLGKRVLFIGAESSGKTTIAKQCATFFSQSTWVPEYGREMWDKREGNLLYDDMLHIGLTQVENEEDAMKQKAMVFCDTSPLVTKFYSEELFNAVDPQLDILAQRTYDWVFWCTRDFGYVEDGTRNGVEFGTKQEVFYKNNLDNFTVLTGSVKERLNTIERVLQLTYRWI